MKKHTTLLALAALFFVACEPQPPKADLAQIKTEIQEAEKRYAEAYNAADVEALLALYADDAQGMSNERPLISGKENLRKDLTKEMADRNTDYKFTFTTIDISGDENTLVETGLTTITHPDGKTETSGKYLAVWKKQGDKWLITHDISNENKPRGPMGYKSIHLLDLPKDVEEAELADALARLNAAISVPGAGYFLYKVEDDSDETYHYYFEGAWPSKAAYDAIHGSEGWKKAADEMKGLYQKLEADQIYRKVMLVE
ncbi:MAG: SgcJ/EcaC family oxidoreductase [Flavobacteriales bacterium]|nr:SgcJ/EcaC family oxidoreductase [Flavobacteriales bacterium]